MSLRPHKLQFLGLEKPKNENKLHIGGPARMGKHARATDILQFSVRVYGGSLPTGNQLSLRCFMDRSADVPDTTVQTNHGSVATVRLACPRTASPGQTMYMWCYAERALCGEVQLVSKQDMCNTSFKQINVMRVGFMAVELGVLRQTGVFGAAVVDVDYVPVATCDMWVDEKQLSQRDAVMQKSTQLGKPMQVFNRPSQWLSFEGQIAYMNETHPLLKDTNITELGRRVFSTIDSSTGPLPMWAFPYEMYRTVQWRIPQQEGYRRLLRLLKSAEFFTGLRADSDSTTAVQMAQLLNEFATVRSRACCYVLDSSLRPDGKEHSLDEWTFISDNPRQDLVAYDCEEGACDGIGCLALLTAPSMDALVDSHKGLRQLRAAQSRYIPLMAIVTLRIMATGRHSYHAIVLDLDSEWLSRHIEQSGLQKLSGSPAQQDVRKAARSPGVAMEFTMYSEGCWEGDIPQSVQAQQKTVYRQSQLDHPVCSNPKAPAAMVAEVSLYGHVHTLFTPSLVDSDGICQLWCSYGGRLGIPVAVLLQGSSGQTNNDIRFIPVRSGDKQTLSQLDTQLNGMPRQLPFLESEPSDIKTPSPSAGPLIFDATYRKVDLDTPGAEDSVREQIKGLSNKCVIARTDVQVSSGMHIARVQAWSA